MIIFKSNTKDKETIYKCDRCGIRTPDAVIIYKRFASKKRNGKTKDFDLCINCYKMLKRSIDKRKKCDNLKV